MKIILIIVSFICLEAYAQKPLRLEDVVNIALKNSLDVQLAKNEVEVNTILNNYGVAGGLPTVTGTASDNEQLTAVNQKLSSGMNIQRNAALANNLNAGVSAGFLLYNGYRVVATKKRLEQIQNQSEQYVNSQVQNVIASVMTGYYDIVRQQSYQKTIDLSLEVAQKKLSIIQTQQSVGLANNADLFQAQLDVNNLLQTKQSQQLVIEQAKTELLRLMTLRTDSAIVVEDTILVDKSVMLDSILSKITTNADILAANEQVKISGQIVKETAAQRYPSVRATTGYSYSRSQAAAGNFLLNESYGPLVGLSLSVPIYNGSVFKRQQRAAEINVRSADVQKQVLLRDYTANAVSNYQALMNSLQQLETARKNYELAQKLVDLVFQRFQLRQATIVEFTIAQQSFQEAGYSLVNLSFAAKAAEIELKRLANILRF